MGIDAFRASIHQGFTSKLEVRPSADNGDDQPIYSFSIITTVSNKLVSRFHNRMPVILNPSDYDAWLSPETDAHALRNLLAPYPDKEMDQFEVSRKINSPKNDSADLLTSVSR